MQFDFFQNKNLRRQTKPSVTSSQLLHNQSQQNSACNLISTQLEYSCQKLVHQKQMNFIRQNKQTPKNKNCIEFGSGWTKLVIVLCKKKSGGGGRQGLMFFFFFFFFWGGG